MYGAQKQCERNRDVQRRQDPESTSNVEPPQRHRAGTLRFQSQQRRNQVAAEEEKYSDAESSWNDSIEPNVRHENQAKRHGSYPVQNGGVKAPVVCGRL